MSNLKALKEVAKDLSALIVEDSIAIQNQMRVFLEKLFDKVFVAKNGLEALEICKNYDPNIILTDIQMPKMDGHEFIENLNKTKHSSKIIVCSAYGYSENIEKFSKEGITNFIQKPVNFDQLTNTLLKVIVGEKDEDNFEDELLKNLVIIKKNKAPITLINHYKGLPFIHEGIITLVKEDSIKVQTLNVQVKVILKEKTSTIETNNSTIKVRLKEFDEQNNELIFDNLEKLEHSPKKREVIRVVPDENFTASVFKKDDRYSFEVSTISTKAISFEVKFFDEKIKLNESVNLTLSFNTYYGTSYHDTQTHKERVDTKATILKIEKLENNLTKIVMLLDLSIANKKILEKYIYQREVAIVKEFKQISLE
ncbi:response regulator receiver protein [Arcobacter nitrofigilis DSM 7299]|uniref:Response regulator receiver protein n=1 Tax=Arcobacter nitrofigilis (strain ATCC 33309 / DSM 7299 / CCUG 15893 / LMG 7604 / NCTC 12251 / CI) TaxID=572480 RepID=D5V5L9_ARCNC|nr:response regulator [Arcobacter nitrofigilis]ADG92055.1 response regulator receiver protein [Arcobacter nitrofigilis DSM 7299]